MWRRWGKKKFFGIYWWTWKPNIYLKNCWSGPIKNKIFIFIQRYRAWQTEIGNFRSFFAPKNQKKKNPLKKWKNSWIYHRFTHVYQKSKSYNVWFLRYRVRQMECFVILSSTGSTGLTYFFLWEVYLLFW